MLSAQFCLSIGVLIIDQILVGFVQFPIRFVELESCSGGKSPMSLNILSNRRETSRIPAVCWTAIALLVAFAVSMGPVHAMSEKKEIEL